MKNNHNRELESVNRAATAQILRLGRIIEALKRENALLKREAREAIETLGGYADEPEIMTHAEWMDRS